MNKVDFDNRIVITGFGIVAQAMLPLLLKHVNVRPDQISVIDFSDRTEALRPWMGAGGVRFVNERITPESLPRLLAESVGPGSLVIDLAWSTDFFAMVDWAHENDALYVNASLESWDPSSELQTKSVVEKSLYARYVRTSNWHPAGAARPPRSSIRALIRG